MSSFVQIISRFRQPSLGHAWRDSEGAPHACVGLGGSELYFDDPAMARAVSAACTQAAEAMEALPPAEPTRPAPEGTTT